MDSQPRFIILDPFLSLVGGHPFDFAQRVIAAAENQGFRGVIAGNRRFRESGCATCAVQPVYGERLWLRQLTAVAVRGFQVSALGWMRQPIGCLARALNDRQYLQRAQQFAHDTRRFLQSLSLTATDTVFIPNMSCPETLGLVRLFERSPELLVASWHLEYHYDVPATATNGGLGGRGDCERLEGALRNLQRVSSGKRVRLYTDTDDLTLQYNELGAGRFSTLPIPIAPEFRPTLTPINSDVPRHIVFMGDIRTEKGYELLPAIVRAIWRDLVATGQTRFTIQSNFNRRWRHASLLQARAELEWYSPPAVNLIKQSLSSAEYVALVQSADIILLPYDEAAYQSRSSGILAEALAAGKPVVVPALSWMARQLGDGATGTACGKSLPGVVYCGGPEAIAAALRKIVTNFEEFRRAALHRSQDWRSYHNPQSLVAGLNSTLTGSSDPDNVPFRAGVPAGCVRPRVA